MSDHYGQVTLQALRLTARQISDAPDAGPDVKHLAHLTAQLVDSLDDVVRDMARELHATLMIQEAMWRLFKEVLMAEVSKPDDDH